MYRVGSIQLALTDEVWSPLVLAGNQDQRLPKLRCVNCDYWLYVTHRKNAPSLNQPREYLLVTARSRLVDIHAGVLPALGNQLANDRITTNLRGRIVEVDGVVSKPSATEVATLVRATVVSSASTAIVMTAKFIAWLLQRLNGRKVATHIATNRLTRSLKLW